MWALARFCAPWVPDAGEKGKNASSRERKAFGMWSFGTRGRSRQLAKAFFSFSPGNRLRCKKRAKPHTPARCHPGLRHRCATEPRLCGPRRPAKASFHRRARRDRGEATETRAGRHGGCPYHAGRDGPPTTRSHLRDADTCARGAPLWRRTDTDDAARGPGRPAYKANLRWRRGDGSGTVFSAPSASLR